MSANNRDDFCAPGVSTLVDRAIQKPKIPLHLAVAAAIARFESLPSTLDQISKYIRKWMPYYRIDENWNEEEFEENLPEMRNIKRDQLGSNVTYDVVDWNQYQRDVQKLTRKYSISDFGLYDHDQWKKFFTYKPRNNGSDSEEGDDESLDDEENYENDDDATVGYLDDSEIQIESDEDEIQILSHNGQEEGVAVEVHVPSSESHGGGENNEEDDDATIDYNGNDSDIQILSDGDGEVRVLSHNEEEDQAVEVRGSPKCDDHDDEVQILRPGRDEKVQFLIGKEASSAEDRRPSPPSPSSPRSSEDLEEIIIIDDESSEALPSLPPSESGEPMQVNYEPEVITLDDDTPIGSPAASDDHDDDDDAQDDNDAQDDDNNNVEADNNDDDDDVEIVGEFDEESLPLDDEQRMELSDGEDSDVQIIEDDDEVVGQVAEDVLEPTSHQTFELPSKIAAEEPRRSRRQTVKKIIFSPRFDDDCKNAFLNAEWSSNQESERPPSNGQKRRLDEQAVDDVDDVILPRKKLAQLRLSKEGAEEPTAADQETEDEPDAEDDEQEQEGEAEEPEDSSTTPPAEEAETITATVHNCPLPIHIYVGLAIINGSNQKYAITSSITKFLGHFAHFKKRNKTFPQDLKAAMEGNEFIVVTQKKNGKEPAKIDTPIYKIKPKKLEDFKKELARFDDLTAEELGVKSKDVWTKAKRGVLKMKMEKKEKVKRVPKEDQLRNFLESVGNDPCKMLLQGMLDAKDEVMDYFRKMANKFTVCAFCAKHNCSVICEEYKYVEDRRKRCKELGQCDRCLQRVGKKHIKDCIYAFCDFCTESGKHLTEMCPNNKRPQ